MLRFCLICNTIDVLGEFKIVEAKVLLHSMNKNAPLVVKIVASDIALSGVLNQNS